MKRGEGKGRYTESHDIIFQLLVTNCVADTPGPIPIKIGMYVTKYPTFAVHFSGVSDLRPGVKVSVSLLTLLVIVPTSAAVPRILWWIVFLVPNLLSPLSLTDVRWAIMTMLRA